MRRLLGLLAALTLCGCGPRYAKPVMIVDAPFPPAAPDTRPPPPDNCGASKWQALRGRDWDGLAQVPIPGRWRMLWWSQTSPDPADPERGTIRVNYYSRIIVSVTCE